MKYRLKAFIVKYCILYNNQMGHWDSENKRLVYNYVFKTLCNDCSLEYTFRYKYLVNKFVSKKRFVKKFTALHKRCAECSVPLYSLNLVKIKTNYISI